MNISELAKDWSGENGRDNFKKAKDQAPSWDDHEAVIKELREEAKVVRAKLKEATSDLNSVNNAIAFEALNGSLTEEKLESLGKYRENAQKSEHTHHRELYYIKEAIRTVTASW